MDLHKQWAFKAHPNSTSMTTTITVAKHTRNHMTINLLIISSDLYQSPLTDDNQYISLNNGRTSHKIVFQRPKIR